MKTLLFLIVITTVFSLGCSTPPKSTGDLEKRVQDLEVYSLGEIKHHTQILVDTHPELSSEVKLEIQKLLSDGLLALQDLRKKEAQLIQALLNQSVDSSRQQLDQTEKKRLKGMLQEVYKDKFQNTLRLVDRVNDLADKKLVNEKFQNDFFHLMREFK